MILAALIAASLAVSPCPATPVHRTPLARSGSLGALPWVQGTPAKAATFGIVFAYDARLDPATFAVWTHGHEPVGSRSEKVLWLVRTRSPASVLTLRGRRLGGPETVLARFQRVIDASPHPAQGAEYASIVDLPTAGCWRLDVSTGSARAQFVVQAVAG